MDQATGGIQNDGSQIGDQRPDGYSNDRRALVGLVVPAQHIFDRAGAAAVFELEVALLKRLDCRVVLFVVAPVFSSLKSSRARLVRAVVGAGHRFDVDDIMVVTRTRLFHSWPSLLRIAFAKLHHHWAMAADVAVSNLLDCQEHTLPLNATPIAVVCNYLSGLRVADALVPRSRQLLVLHDVCCCELTGQVVKELQASPNILTLSAADARRIEDKVPGTQCLFGLPKPGIKPLSFGDLVGFCCLANVLDASGPARVADIGSCRLDCLNFRTLDLLFIGGRHQPNVIGLRKFVDHCFLPHLQSRGIMLTIAGDVGPMLWKYGEEPEGVVVLGRVDDLRPLYAAARLVIVPLFDGTGISIKTIEAISYGKAVLSSKAGMRGLDGGRACAIDPPFDLIWAERIIGLLGSRRARRVLRDEAREAVTGPMLDSVLEDWLGLLVGAEKKDVPAVIGMPQYDSNLPLVEWVGDLRPVASLVANEAEFHNAKLLRLAMWFGEQGLGNDDDCRDLANDVLQAEQMLTAR